MTVAWVCSPPSIHSGGHATMFRMVQSLEAEGHRCLVYLQDRHCWSLDQHRAGIAKGWPGVEAEVHNLDGGIGDCHAIVATSWQSAYAVMASRARGARLYLVQDFEPAFAPAGSESLLAEATYRFPFHAITAGRWLAERLQQEYGMTADWFDFGCDLSSYSLATGLDAQQRRRGVAYYCRPSTARRAHELAVMALDLFATRHPDVPIHLFGEPAKRLQFNHHHHGVLSPAQLGRLYNECVAGLVLSATNVSLVPHEMLAAGCIPVVNDAEHNRVVLDNEFVSYAAPTPYALATRLSALVSQSPKVQQANAQAAASSVASRSWKAAGEHVSRVVRRSVEEGAGRPLSPTGKSCGR